MANQIVDRAIEESLQQAIGIDPSTIAPEAEINIFSWLVRTSEMIPPWWSRSRDVELTSIVPRGNHLSIAMYNAITKMVAIPFEVVARDQSNDSHAQQASLLTTLFEMTPGFGAGWHVEYAKYLYDLLATDNGGFMEVIGEGPPDGPIMGTPTSLRHLDSIRCTRTRNPVWPVLYQDDDGRMYKLHYTRVLSVSQMPSPRKEMNGVGLCAVSRSFMLAQNLLDVVMYKMEKLGSRPSSQILVGKGLLGAEILTALRKGEELMDNQGLSRYSKTIAIGSKNTEIGVDKIDMASMEPFDEEVSINLGMFAIAAAFGMDADELWPVSGRSGGGSAGDANLRRMRSRGRLPAQVTSELRRQFIYKVLPAHLDLRFDFRDDEEDQKQALIKDIRARNRERDLVSGASDVRTIRMQMLNDGDVTRRQFEEMELNAGRLPNGRPISVLFYEQDAVFRRHLGFGSMNPLDFTTNDPDEMIAEIAKRRQAVMAELASTSSGNKEKNLIWASHALDWLHDQYKTVLGESLPVVPQASRRLRIDRRVDEPIAVNAEEEDV